jgi:hypothetical protein
MGNVQPTGGSNSMRGGSSVEAGDKTRKSGKYSRLREEAEESFSNSTGRMEKHEKKRLSGDEGEEPPPRGSLNFVEIATSEESEETEKKPLTAQSSPPNSKYGTSVDAKPEVSRGKSWPRQHYRYDTFLPFDPSRFEKLESLLKKGLSESTETQYDISFKRTKQNTVLIEFTTRLKSLWPSNRPPEALTMVVNSVLKEMSPETHAVVSTAPSSATKYTLGNVPYGSKLAGEVASIAEGIIGVALVKCKVTQHDDKGIVVYKVSHAGIKSEFKRVIKPDVLKQITFLQLKGTIDQLEEEGWSQDRIASDSTILDQVENHVRKWFSKRYGLDFTTGGRRKSDLI